MLGRMPDRSPLGVTATAGSLRTTVGVSLAHVWTPDGIDAAPATNGAQVLHLAVTLGRPTPASAARLPSSRLAPIVTACATRAGETATTAT